MTRQIVYAQGMGEAFAEEMARDERVFILGIDVQRSVFGVTAGLVDHFGPQRIRNTPICESGIVGTALDAPVKRVGAPPIPVPGSWFLEQNYVPGPDAIREAIMSVL